jgi:DedD protein
VVSESLKQRIVGAIVLIALAIIIIPLVFDFSGERQVDINSQIPQMPEIEPVVVADPIRPENITPAKPDGTIFQIGVDIPAEAQSLKVEVPTLSSEGSPVGWVLQIASFKDKAAANELVKKLLADDYQAFLREKKSGKGTVNRVFVGPKVLKEKLIKEKTAIDKKYRVDAMLVRFES